MLTIIAYLRLHAIVRQKFTFLKMADDMEAHIIQKPNMTGSIWNYFSMKVDDSDVPIPDELEKPVCKLCNKPVSVN